MLDAVKVVKPEDVNSGWYYLICFESGLVVFVEATHSSKTKGLVFETLDGCATHDLYAPRRIICVEGD